MLLPCRRSNENIGAVYLELDRDAWPLGEILKEAAHRECNTWTNPNSRVHDAANYVL